jgi:hypothetical protein
MTDPRPRRRCWLSWSTGKDCCYALKVLQEDPSVEVVGLLTSINEVRARSGCAASWCRQVACGWICMCACAQLSTQIFSLTTSRFQSSRPTTPAVR